MIKVHTRLFRLAAIGLLSGGLLVGPVACTKDRAVPRYTRFPSGVKNRPKVETSAAEMFVTAEAIAPDAGPGQSELNFFDELESRPEVVNDDALHACMLLGTGVSLPDYDDRVTVAQRLGWLRRKPARPPREAATIGEVSRIMVRMMGDKQRLPPAKATQRLQTMGLLPPEARHYQGLTGAQMVSLLGQVEEALGPADLAAIRKGVRANWYEQAVVDDSDGGTATDGVATADSSPGQPAAKPPAAAAARATDPSSAPPPVVTPVAEPIEQPQPVAPSPWRRGTPLRKPGT